MDLYDVRAAFPSVGHEVLDEMIEEKFEDPSDVTLLEASRSKSFVLIRAHGKMSILLWPGSGGLQGDAAFPEEFDACYMPEIGKWIKETATEDQFFKPPAKKDYAPPQKS